MNTASKIEFVGSEYGGFPCCLDNLDKNSIVLDVGVGEDISFALSLHEKIGCKIELFDFTPDSITVSIFVIINPPFILSPILKVLAGLSLLLYVYNKCSGVSINVSLL